MPAISLLLFRQLQLCYSGCFATTSTQFRSFCNLSQGTFLLPLFGAGSFVVVFFSFQTVGLKNFAYCVPSRSGLSLTSKCEMRRRNKSSSPLTPRASLYCLLSCDWCYFIFGSKFEATANSYKILSLLLSVLAFPSLFT